MKKNNQPTAFRVADEIIKQSGKKRMTYPRLKLVMYAAYNIHANRYGEPLFDNAGFVEGTACPGVRLMDMVILGDDRLCVCRKDIKYLRSGRMGKKRKKSVKEALAFLEGIPTYEVVAYLGDRKLMEKRTAGMGVSDVDDQG